jgi:hypothetical protein
MSAIFLHLDEFTALSADAHQWMVMRRGHKGDRYGKWVPKSFVATHKRVLVRVLEDKGIDIQKLDEATQRAFKSIPDTFQQWRAENGTNNSN